MKIKKSFVAFELGKAIDDVTRVEVLLSDYQFSLSMMAGKSFDNESDAQKFIYDTMEDYEKRGYSKDVRFLIIPVLHFEDDKIFNPH